MKRRKILFFGFLLLMGLSYAQVVQGVVLDKETGKSLQNVKISPEGTDSWTLTDANGSFKIDLKGHKELVFILSGYTEIKQRAEENMEVLLSPATIYIKEVQLTAKRRRFSEIDIKEEAIKNNQSFSIADVLTQLPGQFIKPLNNNEFKNVVFRTGSGQGLNNRNNDSYGNKAAGVSVLVDGLAVSNNENMQQYNSPYSAVYRGLSSRTDIPTPSLPNYGADLREITVGDIENIKVVQGIPDAKYGDLTTGLIIVETKSGKKPLQINASLQRGTYQVDVTKGFQINKKGDAINFLINYMDANPNPRNNLTDYKRIVGKILWEMSSRDKTVRNKINFQYAKNLDEGKTDPDDYKARYVKASKVGIVLSDNFMMKFKDRWIDGLSANVRFSYDKQKNIDKQFVNLGGRPYGTAMENSVYYAPYTPVTFMTERNVEGIPINLNMNVEMYKLIESRNKWRHNISAGGAFIFGDNIGRGRFGTTNSAIVGISNAASNMGYRDYDYSKNVPASVQYSAYLQDNLRKDIGEYSSLSLNAGLRLDIQNSIKTLSPRFNASYKYKNISLRGGVGLTSKAPTLAQLYTGDRFLDYLIGDFRLPGKYNVAVMQTVVTKGDNVDLKPSKSWKTEVGLDYKLPFAMLSLTAYYNKLFDGFTNVSELNKTQISDVKINYNGNQPPTYQIIGQKDYYYTHSRITNALNSVDKGIELGINFKRIEALNLEVALNATYVRTDDKSDVRYLQKSNIETSEYTYGVFTAGGNAFENARINGTFAYHLSQVGLILALQTNTFLLDNFYVDANNKYPEGYYDRNLTYHPIPESERADAKYQNIHRQATETTTQRLGKVLHNIHLRVTKNFLSGFQASVYVYNVLNSRPARKNLNNGSIEEYDFFTPISFGANLSYKF